GPGAAAAFRPLRPRLARMRDPLARLPPALQLRDRPRFHGRQEAIETFRQPEDPQHPDEHDDIRPLSRLEALERALADARLAGELRLGEPGVDAVRLEARAELAQERLVGEICGDLHIRRNGSDGPKIRG